MSVTVRSASLALATIASLLIVAIGLGALVETDDPDWEVLVLGLVSFTATVLPLLVGRGRRDQGPPSRRRTVTGSEGGDP